MTSSRRPPLALVAVALLIGVASLTPVGYILLREGFTPGRLASQLNNPSTVPLLKHTVELALGVAGVCAVVGVGLALLVVRTDLPFRRLWTVLFTLPLGVPAFVSSYTWVAANLRFFPESHFISTYPGVVAILSLSVYPYVFLPVVAALHDMDPAQEEVARAAGHGRLSAFLRVTLPQLRVAIAGGMLIIALDMVAEFGALQLLGYRTLTTAIVERITVLGAPEAARALSVVLAAAALIILAGERFVRGRLRPARVGSGAARPPAAWQLGWARPLWLLASLGLILAAMGVPLYVSVVGLVNLTHGGSGVDWSDLIQATVNTAEFAAAGAIAATITALPVSFLSVRYPGVLATIAERSTWVAQSLPGVIMALALVFIGAHWLYPLYQSTTMLVIDYVILFLPLAVASQAVGIAHAGAHFEDISRSLGKGRLTTFVRVTIPLALPAIGTGALLVLLNIGKELTTTLLLHPIGKQTLSTALWQTTNGEVLDFTTAAPYGIALIIIGAIPAYFLARQTLKPRR